MIVAQRVLETALQAPTSLPMEDFLFQLREIARVGRETDPHSTKSRRAILAIKKKSAYCRLPATSAPDQFARGCRS